MAPKGAMKSAMKSTTSKAKATAAKAKGKAKATAAKAKAPEKPQGVRELALAERDDAVTIKVEKNDDSAAEKKQAQRNFKGHVAAATNRLKSCIDCVGKTDPGDFCKKCTRD